MNLTKIVGAVLAATLIVTALPTAASAADGTSVLVPSDDTYTFPESPGWNAGERSTAESSSYPRIKSTAWMKFDLSALPSDAVVTDARLELSTAWSNRASVAIHAAPTNWTEAMTHGDAVPVGARLQTVSSNGPTVRADVTTVASAAGSEVAFAIPPAASDGVGFHFFTSESSKPPRLTVSWTRSTTVVEPPTSTDSNTLFGATIYHRGQTFAEGLSKSDANFGRMDAVRVFYPGAPAAWPVSAGYANRPVVLSFKLPMREIIAGRHDSRLRQWFSDAPRDRLIWWSLNHEPEDDIERRGFTASEYRQAWQRVSELADTASNPRLRATLILMDWTLNPLSGRNWRDYYAGDRWIDTIAFDPYNPSSWNGYIDPHRLLDKLAALSQQTGKPFGIAEFGSQLMNGDGGVERARWLKDFAGLAEELGAEFVLYWDSSDGPSSDYRLMDPPSIRAWRDVVSG